MTKSKAGARTTRRAPIVEKIRSERAAGDTPEEIAERHGLSRRYVVRNTEDVAIEPSLAGHRGTHLAHEDEDARMWTMWARDGKSYAEIGAEFGGLTAATVAGRLQTYRRNNLAVVDREAVLYRELEMLDRFRRELIEIMEEPAPPLYSNGRAVKGPDGEAVADLSIKIQAIDRLLKVSERQAKMLGLDSPDKLQVEAAVVHYELTGVSPEDLT